MRELPQTTQQEWKPLSETELAKFKTQLIAGSVWLLHTLDETERARRTGGTRYDIPVKSRLKQAS